MKFFSELMTREAFEVWNCRVRMLRYYCTGLFCYSNWLCLKVGWLMLYSTFSVFSEQTSHFLRGSEISTQLIATGAFTLIVSLGAKFFNIFGKKKLSFLYTLYDCFTSQKNISYRFSFRFRKLKIYNPCLVNVHSLYFLISTNLMH